VNFTIGLLLVRLITLFIALVLIELTFLLVINNIPTLKRAITNEITMLTIIVAYSLGC
jgi:hypothetical protein